MKNRFVKPPNALFCNSLVPLCKLAMKITMENHMSEINYTIIVFFISIIIYILSWLKTLQYLGPVNILLKY